MRLPVNPPMCALLPRAFAGGCVAAFLLALVFLVVPRVHDRAHASQGGEHTCLVTVLAAGGCDDVAEFLPRASAAPRTEGEILCVVLGLPVAAVSLSSVLEHAPPRLA